ncbi:hypothetical protein D3C87_1379810 [compost metagenome]
MLQAGEAIETEVLRKPHQRGRLHLRRLRYAGRGAEGDFVRMLQRIGADLHEPLGQRGSLRHDCGTKGFEILWGNNRRRGHGGFPWNGRSISGMNRASRQEEGQNGPRPALELRWPEPVRRVAGGSVRRGSPPSR